MTTTYVELGKQTSLTSNEVVFDAIPGVYKHLELKLSLRTSLAAIYGNVRMQFNGDQASNYSYRFMEANTGNGAVYGGTISTNYIMAGTANGNNNPSSTFAICSVFINDYTRNQEKRVYISSQTANSGTAYMNEFAAGWTGTSAIASIRIYTPETFVAGSSAFLYGII